MYVPKEIPPSKKAALESEVLNDENEILIVNQLKEGNEHEFIIYCIFSRDRFIVLNENLSAESKLNCMMDKLYRDLKMCFTEDVDYKGGFDIIVQPTYIKTKSVSDFRYSFLINGFIATLNLSRDENVKYLQNTITSIRNRCEKIISDYLD